MADEKVDIKKIYSYLGRLLGCDICRQGFPLWMVSDKDWTKGRKRINDLLGRGYISPRGKVCKACWELFNPDPHYLALDEYMDAYAPEEWTPERRLKFRARLAETWDWPSEYTAEVHREITEAIRNGLEMAKSGRWDLEPY